ncbi:MAG: hypothetical protein SH820_14210 [Xanthomonadales bacterium]|nr:hypothetical protein [Xanthomonadales bacterium]
MINFIQQTLGPYYFFIKFIHLYFVMVWMWSTAVAFAFYLVPVFKAWRRNPDDPQIIAMRDWAIERFDHGVSYEHVAFPIILITGPLLLIVGGWNMDSGWLVLKLLIVIGIFIPVESFDYYISHLGGNKARLRQTGDPDIYERSVQRHWMFLLVSSPPVMVFGTLIIVLAVTKPF